MNVFWKLKNESEKRFMSKKIYVYNPYANVTVAREYISTIQAAVESLQIETVEIQSLEKQNKKNRHGIIVAAVQDATKAKKHGYFPVITWVQGIIPEESYMRNSSKFRSFVLSCIEKKGLKDSDFLFYVSDAMANHFERKYHFSTQRCYMMPCFNSAMDKASFMTDGKYINNTFLYAGSIDPWQCFDETLYLFKEIEARVPNATLRIMTSQQEQAKQKAEQIGIKNYTVGFAPGNQIVQEMANAKFGFSLRRDHPVNNVATPTKLSTYVTNGVIPVYSQYVRDFCSKSKENRFAVQADEENAYGIEKIVSLCEQEISAEEVWNEFGRAYGNYYSRDYHIARISEIFRGYLSSGEEDNG